MSEIKKTVFFQLLSPKTRKILVLRLYRSLLKAISQESAVSADILLRAYLKTRISMKFAQFSKLHAFSRVFEEYWRGVEFLQILKNLEKEGNAEVLLRLAYGPLRFKRALSLNFASLHAINREKAEKIIELEIKDKKLAYNYAVPKEILEYMNENPRKFKVFCEPSLEIIKKSEVF